MTLSHGNKDFVQILAKLHLVRKMFAFITSSMSPETATCYIHSALLTPSVLLMFYLTYPLNICSDSWKPISLPCHSSCYKLFLLSG